MKRVKTYVKVNVDHNPDGTCRPNSITFENGDKYIIDYVRKICHAAATKVGGVGIRYTIEVNNHETYLFEDEGKWFVEAKV